MILRIVTVTVAPGKADEYWAWADEIVALWDAHNVKRQGGPYRRRADERQPDSTPRDGANDGLALWFTLHQDMAEIENEFRTLYADGPGQALIERRPPLVADTQTAYYDIWPFQD